jgi:hypothetical protein
MTDDRSQCDRQTYDPGCEGSVHAAPKVMMSSSTVSIGRQVLPLELQPALADAQCADLSSESHSAEVLPGGAGDGEIRVRLMS